MKREHHNYIASSNNILNTITSIMFSSQSTNADPDFTKELAEFDKTQRNIAEYSNNTRTSRDQKTFTLKQAK